MKKLFEFHQALECAVVVAAASEQEAREAIRGWERAWINSGDFIGIQDDPPDLFDVREPSSQDALKDEAHVIVSEYITEPIHVKDAVVSEEDAVGLPNTR